MAANQDALNLALDDVIKENTKERGLRQDSRKSGGIRKRDLPPRNSPYNTREFQVRGRNRREGNLSGKWSHDKFEDSNITSRLGSRSNDDRSESRSGITVENLHYNVSEDDLRDLFKAFGTVDKVKIKFDRSGRSEGEANIRFISASAAQNAYNKYNGVELDGQPMQMRIHSEDRPRSGGAYRSERHGRGSGGSRAPQRKRGSDRRGNSRPQKSQEELDAELDNYANSGKSGLDEDVEMA